MTELTRGVWVIAYRELLRYVQERARIVSSVAMPLLFLVIFGAGFNRIIGALAPGVDYIRFMYPGILAMTVLMSSMFSGLSVVWDREFGFLREVLVAPLSRTGIVLGKTTGTGLVAILQGAIMLALAPLLGVHLTASIVLRTAGLLVLLSFSISSLGMLLASRMRSQQGFQLTMQLLLFPMIFLSGIFFPVGQVARWLEVVAKVNPLTYGVDAIRQVFLSGGLAPVSAGPLPVATLGVSLLGHTMTVLEDVAVVLAWGLALLAAATWAFQQEV